LGTKLEIVWVLPDYYERYPKPCMGGWARAYLTVTPAGEVWPCHAAGRITTLRFENVRARSLEWIWYESDAFTRFRGEDWMPEPCRSCPRRAEDFGGCRCQAFLIAGDAAATDPVCARSPARDERRGDRRPRLGEGLRRHPRSRPAGPRGARGRVLRLSRSQRRGQDHHRASVGDAAAAVARHGGRGRP